MRVPPWPSLLLILNCIFLCEIHGDCCFTLAVQKKV
jgi:hypothetical protein